MNALQNSNQSQVFLESLIANKNVLFHTVILPTVLRSLVCALTETCLSKCLLISIGIMTVNLSILTLCRCVKKPHRDIFKEVFCSQKQQQLKSL